MKTKILIINIIASLFVVMIFLIALTFILFHHQNSPTALKDSWSTVGSFFGGIATLSTAYVASLLFNDWKLQHNQQTEKEFIININNLHNNLNDYIFEKQGNMHKAMNIYKYVGTNLPAIHNQLIIDVYLLHNSLLKYLVNFKISIQNYGLISKNTELTNEIIFIIDNIEGALEKEFQPIRDRINNETPSNMLNAFEVYNNYMSIELSAALYEVAVYPLLKKIPA